VCVCVFFLFFILIAANFGAGSSDCKTGIVVSSSAEMGIMVPKMNLIRVTSQNGNAAFLGGGGVILFDILSDSASSVMISCVPGLCVW
jgi:hypothetical protein